MIIELKISITDVEDSINPCSSLQSRMPKLMPKRLKYNFANSTAFTIGMLIKAEGVLNKDRYLFECSDGTNTLAMFIDEDDCLMVSVNGQSVDMGTFNNYSTFSTIIASFEILDDEVLVCVYNNGSISGSALLWKSPRLSARGRRGITVRTKWQSGKRESATPVRLGQRETACSATTGPDR